jgi:hypothetical protein
MWISSYYSEQSLNTATSGTAGLLLLLRSAFPLRHDTEITSLSWLASMRAASSASIILGRHSVCWASPSSWAECSHLHHLAHLVP